MKTAISLTRIAIIFATSAIAFIGLLSEPLDDSTTWLSDLVISKTIGIIFAVITVKLYKRWQNDQLIRRIETWEQPEKEFD